jgi:hypothetical protein
LKGSKACFCVGSSDPRSGDEKDAEGGAWSEGRVAGWGHGRAMRKLLRRVWKWLKAAGNAWVEGHPDKGDW